MGAHLEIVVDRPVRIADERGFDSHDGTRLFFRHWPARTPGAPRGAILLLHRGHEHGGRMAHLPDELGLEGFACYALDARGHGRSEAAGGTATEFADLVRDLDCFVRHLAETDGVNAAEIAIVAQSVGAVIAATWVHDYAPPIRAMVLAAPAFDINLYVPLARPALAAWHRLHGDFRVNSYVQPGMLTRDAARAAAYRADPLIVRAVQARLLLGLYETSERLIADARAITVPTQLLVSGADMVVREGAQHRFYVNLGSARKERHVLDGFRHDVLGERDRAPVLAEVRRFLADGFARPAAAPSLLDADQAGHTRDEHDTLATPVPALSARGLYWRVQCASVALGSRLSRGMAIGRRTGFDSGSSLDYVYRDRAEGTGPIGRMIDRAYLDAVGWRGIRQRKRHVEALCGLSLARLAAEGRPRRIVDIAAGHGRYVLDTLAASTIDVDSIVLRDFCPENVAAGRRLIAGRGLEAVARFERGDAFDAEALAALQPRPTLAIVSGLYELFPENAPVRRSLNGLARAVPPGGYLVYTGQPWHPQLEFIARALTSHRGGRAWVMRRRTQAELDQLVAAAGFRKVEQRIDRWGIFTVSLAQRIAD